MFKYLTTSFLTTFVSQLFFVDEGEVVDLE